MALKENTRVLARWLRTAILVALKESNIQPPTIAVGCQ